MTNLVGIVLSVITTQNNRAEFVVRSIDKGDLRCSYNGFLPLQESDTIHGYTNDKNVFIDHPFVCIPVDENHVKQCFIRALRGTGFGEISAQRLYDNILTVVKSISNLSNGSDGVIFYLTDLASKYSKTYSKFILEILITSCGLTESQASALMSWWHNKRSMRRLYLLGLTKADIANCTTHVRAVAILNSRPRVQDLDEIFEQCIKNPLVLSAISMEKALNIANMLNIKITPEMKECGYIIRTIYNHTERNSWTCSPEFIMKKHHPDIGILRDQLVNEYNLIFDKNCVYLPYPYLTETKVAAYITRLIAKTVKEYPTLEGPQLEEANYLCPTLSFEQKNAIQQCLNHYVSIITGPPGSGKSSLIKELCHNLSLREIPYMCASFTGKAVSRIIEVTNSTNAMTLDRMIAQFTKVMGFKHLIIDEVSMVTSELLYRFIRVFPGEMRITFIGDIDQLPPTSWGGLFHQLISCGKIPVYRLTHSYRVGEEDKLILNNANELVNPSRDLSHPLIFDQGKGFTQIEEEGSIRSLLNAMKNSGIEVDMITAISPYNADLDDINRMFQEVFLPTSEKIFYKEKLWCVGDRIIMVVNNYDINVMNGEEGKVIAISSEGITVKFKSSQSTHLFKFKDDPDIKTKIGDAYNDIDWEDKELLVSQISHAFCLTVHKSQGSEYNFVIVYIPTRGEKYSTFVNINLLYTAITRTKRAIWLIGRRDTINKVTITERPHRYDMLKVRLIELNKDITKFESQKEEEDNILVDDDAMMEAMNSQYN